MEVKEWFSFPTSTRGSGLTLTRGCRQWLQPQAFLAMMESSSSTILTAPISYFLALLQRLALECCTTTSSTATMKATSSVPGTVGRSNVIYPFLITRTFTVLPFLRHSGIDLKQFPRFHVIMFTLFYSPRGGRSYKLFAINFENY